MPDIAGNGEVVPAPKIFCVYWGAAFTEIPDAIAKTNQFVSDLLVSRYMDGVAGYGVGLGRFVGHTIIPDAEVPRVTSEVAEDALKYWIHEGMVPVVPDEEKALVYLVFLPHGPDVKESVNDESSPALFGYHHWSNDFPNLIFGVIRWPDDTEIQQGDPNVEGIAPVGISHELIEAITDPNGHGILLNAGGQGPIEIVDFCVTDPTNPETSELLLTRVNGMLVQRYWSAAANDCFPARELFQPRIFFSLINHHSGKALDVPIPDHGDGVLIQQYEAHQHENQQWLLYALGQGLYKIVSRLNGKVLEVLNASPHDNGAIVQRQYGHRQHQHWKLVPSQDEFLIVSDSSGKILDVPDSAKENAVKIQQFTRYENPDHDNQRWRIDFADSVGFFVIRSRASGLVVTAPASGNVDGVQLTQEEVAAAHGGSTIPLQRFKLVAVPDGFVKIVFASTNSVLEVAGESVDDQAAVQLFSDKNKPHQHWRLVPIAGGYFKIVNRNSQKNLDLPPAGASTQGIQQYKDNGGLWNQQWEFVPVA